MSKEDASAVMLAAEAKFEREHQAWLAEEEAEWVFGLDE
jgi:hypothetical protein